MEGTTEGTVAVASPVQGGDSGVRPAGYQNGGASAVVPAEAGDGVLGLGSREWWLGKREKWNEGVRNP
jgi:hypothetical protein